MKSWSVTHLLRTASEARRTAAALCKISARGLPTVRRKERQIACRLEGMASPIVPRRSARLMARTPTASAVRSPSSSPERMVMARKRKKNSEHIGNKVTSILAKQELISPKSVGLGEQKVVTIKRRKNPEHFGKRVTSILVKQQVVSPKRGKISSYFSKIVSGGNKKKTVKGSKGVVKTTCEAGNKCSEIRSKFLAPIRSGEETQVQVKKERLLNKGPSRDMEAELWEMGFQHIAGVDEAGRGPLAGPVVAAACIIPSHVIIDGINDSKKLTEERREELYSQLTTTPGISYAVHVIDAKIIDEVNILQATMQAMAACVEKLHSVQNGLPRPDYVLIDGNRLPSDIPQKKARSVIKGDAICHVIAAASILAKVTRDRLMISYDEKWPMYGFKAHKGYGTAAHIAAIRKHGPCDIHRLSFAPLKDRILATSGA